jgi:4'-phosphopantetheinyl transferase EntD
MLCEALPPTLGGKNTSGKGSRTHAHDGKFCDGENYPMKDSWPVITQVAQGAILVVDLIEQCQEPLMESEEILATAVTLARVRELRAGRSSARCAIRHLKFEPAPILSADTGAPIWPAGLCGSLSHTHHHVAALVACSSYYDSVGVDINDGRVLGEKALGDVATPEELALVSWVTANSEANAVGNMTFSAKEALFKCQYTITQDASLDFLEVRLIVSDVPGVLGVRVVDPARSSLSKLLSRIYIYFISIHGLTATYALFPR